MELSATRTEQAGFENQLPAIVSDRLNAICASSGFGRSPRLQSFLRYVVEHSVCSGAESLKEYQIAIDVFERRPSFNSQLDPIVRVEAGRLRLRMTEYYAGPGQNDEILIEIGKGGYRATFRNNPGRAPTAPDSERAASASAYRLYLKGRYFWDKRTPTALAKALGYFEMASALDPACALASMGIADCSFVSAAFEFAAPGAAVSRARESARKVLLQGDLSAQAHTTLSAIQAFHDRDWVAAEAGFRRAIEIDATYATAWQWYGVCCSALGRQDDGLNALRKATECDPLALMANAQLACGLYLARRYEEAREACGLALEIDSNCWPARYFLGLIFEQQKLFSQAIRELQQANDLSEGNPLTTAAIAHVYARAGSQMEARKLAAGLAQEDVGYVSEWALALAYIGLEETELAMQSLERSIASRSPQPAIFLSNEPRLDCLRGNGHFQQIQQQLYSYTIGS